MTEWISVEDRMPRVDDHVLIYAKKNPLGFSEGIYTGFYKKCWDNNFQWSIRHEVTGWEWDDEFPLVTHWMPLPEIP